MWGVLNVTPDSFSDGGHHFAPNAAIERAFAILREGAHVVDVGGESTRPQGVTYGAGASVVSVDEELRRVLPVVEALVTHGAVASVDTTKGAVARRVLEAGARIINDVSCGRDDELLAAVASHGAELVLMHSRGRGEVAPPYTNYTDLFDDVVREWDVAAARAERFGVPRAKLWFDVGPGFAKTAAQSMEGVRLTSRFASRGVRVLVAASRKSFLGAYATEDATVPSPGERVGASVAAALFAARSGASAVRVHDVRETVQALRIEAALCEEARA